MMGGIRNYLIVTASYWSFTLTDGALRMLVLLHFYTLGYTPFTLATLFLLYETAGIFANLGGGWLATRFGIPRMLPVGLVLQIAGLLLLSVATRWRSTHKPPRGCAPIWNLLGTASISTGRCSGR
jgi:predicted MFS family arabinose efflux permease